MDARTRYAAENPKIKVLEAQVEELRKMVSNPSQGGAGEALLTETDANPFQGTG